MGDSNSDNKGCGKFGCSSVMWWVTLTVAVVAVPAFGILVASIVHMNNIGDVFAFVVACWFCTYLGMLLMKDPRMAKKLGDPKKDQD